MTDPKDAPVKTEGVFDSRGRLVGQRLVEPQLLTDPALADISAEVVEGYAHNLEARGFIAEAATLRALAAERDILAAERDAAKRRKAHIDTSAEAVGKLRAEWRELTGPYLAAWAVQADATLRALAAARDAVRAECASLKRSNEFEVAFANKMISERDAALTEAARLREVLLRWQHYGCPDCGGDCRGVNAPIVCGLMRETQAALAQEAPRDDR